MYPGLFASRTKQGSKGQPPLGGVWGVPTFPLFFLVRGGEDGNFRKALPCIDQCRSTTQKVLSYKVYCCRCMLGLSLARFNDRESEKEKMTDTKQVERNMQNIHASNEHSSYCECIWCLEKDTQLVGSSDLGKQEIEQEMAAMLKDLPLPITIKQQGDHYNDEYIWHCMGTTGKAYSFVDATRQALQSFIAISR
jgi:hypothetical protein